MGTDSRIEWCDHTWNPWQGCRKFSEGCTNCYMFREKKRYGQDPERIVRSQTMTFRKPLRDWKQPARVFTCSWSDFFLPDADAWRPEAWEIIRQTPHLTYQILTKRPGLIKPRLPADWGDGWPNVWLGCTAENQAAADARISELLSIPAQLRFVSVEPMLGPVDLRRWLLPRYVRAGYEDVRRRFPGAIPPPGPCGPPQSLDWVIVGGESGPDARPFNIAWAVDLLRQCEAASIPFFFKQLGRRPYAGENQLGEKHWMYGDSDGRDKRLWPDVLRVQQFPEAHRA